ncbi:MAG: ATP-dependent RNA helicase HrpA, partial [Lautropia sp.]
MPAELRQLIDDLPVSAHRQPIIDAIRQHPVIIVCGETGSGKTTQLPKLCLVAGRGWRDPAGGRGGLIGHTQPRRLAATTVAQRIAAELGTPLGVDVGYKIRFNEKVSRTARIKLMTDGILLAESQNDPLLSRYDTIIIDEAHERSLNIDFLLGYLKRLIDGPRRDDLKLVITSATIDATRFARHFARGEIPAPVIEVSGRLFPVEIRYRPLQAPDRPQADARARPAQRGPAAADEEDETDLPSAIETAIVELWSRAAGDVLVFLPGEREIRECADHLRRAAARAAAGAGRRAAAGGVGRLLAAAEVIPLFARLGSADQQRVFSPGPALRVVLATNVAETSLTVPRIRYVIDSGLARVRRYRIRGKVEQLHIEPISQAAANQRAGRCGRVQDGTCVRLFDEDDFRQRPQYTEPEILRSSLAAVILRMSSLGLDEVDAFPFLDPPSPKAIADGYALLLELGAMDERRQLTTVGRQLARLPVDPRIARMLLAGHELNCLAEVTVVAAALAAQDPRERPAALMQAADQAHARFADPRSDFLGWLRLWRYWQAQQTGRAARGESHRALAARFGREFLSVRRLREWSDVHGQLSDITRDIRWSLNQSAAKPDAVHRALLAGLLGNIGERALEDAHYQGAHQQKFWLHPSSAVGRKLPARTAGVDGADGAGAHAAGAAPDAAGKSGRWVMAAEMVDTGRLYARTVARIRGEWIETAAAHLISRSWTSPHWERKAGQVMALERGVLYGLVVYAGRRVSYAAIDPALARELMIREGLVPGDWPDELPFIRHNRAVIAEIE